MTERLGTTEWIWRSLVAKVSTDNAVHYTWGNACDGWHFVNQPSLSVIRERMPPGTAEVRHHHESARQFFFVLAGVAVLELDGSSHELKCGEGLEVPPGSPIRSSAGVLSLSISSSCLSRTAMVIASWRRRHARP
jgi:mannose-6-phosphate isomerase-like protein (cupin superfamily)